MFTLSKLGKKIHVLHDKEPRSCYVPTWPQGAFVDYKSLIEHVRNMQIPPNQTHSIQMFDFLSQEVRNYLRNLDYARRVAQYQRIMSDMSQSCWYTVTMINGIEYSNWERFSRENGPVIILEWKYVPMTQILRERFRKFWETTMRWTI